MKKNRAFTLIEILLVAVIIGVLAVIMIKNINSKSFTDKANIANAYKAIEIVQQASAKILGAETDWCPTGKFINKIINNYEFGVINPTTSKEATLDEMMELYGSYLKLQKRNLNFCSYTEYCEDSNTDIKGAKIVGDIYIGFEKFASPDIQDCPTTYYMPESNELIEKEAGSNGKCWGKFYVDVNGPAAPNEFGKDVFVWGLGEVGIVY